MRSHPPLVSASDNQETVTVDRLSRVGPAKVMNTSSGNWKYQLPEFETMRMNETLATHIATCGADPVADVLASQDR